MSLVTLSLQSVRRIATSGVLACRLDIVNKRYNQENVVLRNKRHSRYHKKIIFRRFERPNPFGPDIPVHTYGCRGTGVRHETGWEHIPEKVPQLMVPDLTDFNLKPYVSYKTEDIFQEELTARDLFNVIYGRKIMKDFMEGKLDEDGNSKEPNEFEKMSPEEARTKARQTGSDIFQGGIPRDIKWELDYPIN